jgi:uncharacterized protein YecE (DUF72 family)
MAAIRRNRTAETPTLFDLERPEAGVPEEKREDQLAGGERILVGTSSFTAKGWEGTFYPAGMRPAEFLTHYAKRFRTVEVDSTFYGTPPATRGPGWYDPTPADFVFAAKVPQVITHEKVLVDYDGEFQEFVNTMEALGEKLGPLLLQFGYFSPSVFKNSSEFLARLAPFLKKLQKERRFAVEIRNKDWLDKRVRGFAARKQCGAGDDRSIMDAAAVGTEEQI